MSRVPLTLTVGPPAPADPAGLLVEAAGAAKCAACGCAHEASAALAALPAAAPPRLRDAARQLAASLTPERYPCLGCAVCWPADALSLAQDAGLVPEGAAVPARAGPDVAINERPTTENLGIERLVANTIANPHLRFVIVCGPEVEQR